MSNASKRVLTGAVAIIKYRGKAIGHMRTVTATENIARTNVYQLGSVIPLESAATQWSGTLSCGFWHIDLKRSGVPNALKRDVNSNEEFENNIVLDPDGVQIDVYKREADVIDPETKKITPRESPHFSIRRAFITSDTVNINEGAISGKDQSFNYIDPMILPV